MRLVTAIATIGLFATPAMAQIVIQPGNPAQSQADRQAAHENWQSSREQEYRAQRDAARGDYNDAARHQAEANADRNAARADHHEASQSDRPAIIIGR